MAYVDSVEDGIVYLNRVALQIDYKIDNNLAILDSSREQEVIDINSLELKDSEFYNYYIQYLKDIMKISKEYQLNYLKTKKEG